MQSTNAGGITNMQPNASPSTYKGYIKEMFDRGRAALDRRSKVSKDF